MDGEAGWWTTSGNIGLPPLARVMGVGRQQQHCGASPQDVRHMFACTTHPNDLSPQDIWQNPVGSICAFSSLDNGKLNWLEDGPGRGKQHQDEGGNPNKPTKEISKF